MLLRLLLDLADVGLVVALVVLLLVLLAQAIVVLRLAVVCVLVAHDLGTLRLGLLDGLTVLVLVMLHFLQVRDNQCVVRLLLLLHLRVEVLDLGFKLLDALIGSFSLQLLVVVNCLLSRSSWLPTCP